MPQQAYFSFRSFLIYNATNNAFQSVRTRLGKCKHFASEVPTLCSQTAYTYRIEFGQSLSNAPRKAGKTLFIHPIFLVISFSSLFLFFFVENPVNGSGKLFITHSCILHLKNHMRKRNQPTKETPIDSFHHLPTGY